MPRLPAKKAKESWYTRDMTSTKSLYLEKNSACQRFQRRKRGYVSLEAQTVSPPRYALLDAYSLYLIKLASQSLQLFPL